MRPRTARNNQTQINFPKNLTLPRLVHFFGALGRLHDVPFLRHFSRITAACWGYRVQLRRKPLDERGFTEM